MSDDDTESGSVTGEAGDSDPDTDASAVGPDEPSGPPKRRGLAEESGTIPAWFEDISDYTDAFLRTVEVVAAAVFAALFAIGVIDLILQIIDAYQRGTITDPNTVIGFIDVGLLLLIIVEVYQTVVAYVRETETRRIVRLVVYTGVIAMVRKVIIFRAEEYGSTAGYESALLVSLSYTVIIFGLIGLLYVERARADMFE